MPFAAPLAQLLSLYMIKETSSPLQTDVGEQADNKCVRRDEHAIGRPERYRVRHAHKSIGYGPRANCAYMPGIAKAPGKAQGKVSTVFFLAFNCCGHQFNFKNALSIMLGVNSM